MLKPCKPNCISRAQRRVDKTAGKHGDWYRVVLGPYTTKRATEVDRHKIQRTGIETCQVWLCREHHRSTCYLHKKAPSIYGVFLSLPVGILSILPL